jgi:hypothetical protein
MWKMASDQIERYRDAVDRKASGTKLERIVTDIRGAEILVNRARRAQDRAERLSQGHEGHPVLRRHRHHVHQSELSLLVRFGDRHVEEPVVAEHHRTCSHRGRLGGYAR